MEIIKISYAFLASVFHYVYVFIFVFVFE